MNERGTVTFNSVKIFGKNNTINSAYCEFQLSNEEKHEYPSKDALFLDQLSTNENKSQTIQFSAFTYMKELD